MGRSVQTTQSNHRMTVRPLCSSMFVNLTEFGGQSSLVDCRVCSTLKIIHLDGNKISMQGLKDLARAMIHNKSIISILPEQDVLRLESQVKNNKRDKGLLEKYCRLIEEACFANRKGNYIQHSPVHAHLHTVLTPSGGPTELWSERRWEEANLENSNRVKIPLLFGQMCNYGRCVITPLTTTFRTV